MIKVQKKMRSFREWMDHLLSEEVSALEDSGYGFSDAHISPDEVLDAIVIYYGGLASPSRIRNILTRVYGVELVEE